ncbi:MAG: Ig-like domain-containing protein, partial [Eubacterium sp.]|nr:Ig-like domain-containing protein [Eubacterium sp.]
NSTKEYSYYPNYASYGTETIKKGLRTVDFEHAKNLSSIGTAAFQRANVETIDMSPTAVTSIPGNAFDNCTYLRTVILSDKTESILDNAFKDNLELTSLRAPVSSTFKAKSIYGAYGIVAGKTTDPTLQFTNGMNEPVVVPINGSYTLPINALNTDTINGSPAIYITDESGSDHYLYQNGESDASGYRGLTAEVTQDKNGQYVFTLNGSEYITEEITVKVELGMKFQILQSTSYMINNRTVEYQVKVTEVPTSSVTVSAADDTVVKSVPTMYQENSGSKVLYMPSSGNAVTKGIVLTANVAPVETTDEVVWATTDESVVKVEAISYENGVAKAKITRVGTGSATVSITSGTKSDEISVQCQTSVKSLTAKNEGVNLPETFTSATGGLSKTTPYQMNANNGGVDKIVVTPVYPDGYDGISGEKVIFTTSNDSIVSVDNTGKITTHAASDEVVTITATAQASGTKKIFYLKVVDDAVMTVGSITISAENDAETVYSGSTLQMNAHVTPANAEDKTVTWKITSGTSYATIDSNGLLTANAKGTVKIQASTPDGKVKSNVYSVKIMIKATDLKVIDGDFAMKIGAQKSIYKTSSKTAKTGWSIVPSNADDTVEWTVDNPEVVSLTVSTSKLTLKALQAGTATLTGVTSSGVSTSVTITVNETGTISSGSNGNSNTNTNTGSNLQEIFASAIVCKVNKPSNKKIYVVKKSKTKLKTILTPANTTDKVTYTSNKTSVATVSTTGVITAKKPGTAKITAKTTSGKATTMTVVVLKKKVKAKKVKVKAAKSVKKGKTIQLKVTLSPSKSTDTISFKSSKKSVATVDAYGLVKAKKKGTVKITVKASSGKKKVVTIKVKND